jgi:hypothetical protein
MEHNLTEDEEGEQKPEEGKQKSEEVKKKLISSVPYQNLRQWQTFILALLIIFAYIVFFFGYIITTAQDMPDGKGKNWSGMTTLTGTFGIIAAAVVGYYFGQRNLKQAADIAEHATEIAKEAKDVADKKTVEAKKSKDKLKTEIKKGTKFYETFDKITDPKEKDRTVGEVIKDHEGEGIKTMNDNIRSRMKHLKDVSDELEAQE